jgi:hypothetical protein
MARAKYTARSPEPWEYPHDFTDDPAGVEERRAMDAADTEYGNPEPTSERAISAYWQRHADYAEAWLQANANAPAKQRDRAFAYRIVATRHAQTAGGMKSTYVRPNLELLFQQNPNPLYMWQAIACALSDVRGTRDPALQGPVEIPYWCAQLLRATATRLLHLGRRGAPAATPVNVQKALRLFSQGYSAYVEREKQELDRKRGDFVAELVAAGMSPQRARAVVLPHIGDARALRRAGKRIVPQGKPTSRS